MARILKIVALPVLLVATSFLRTAGAQEKAFDITGQIRLRGESSDKDFDSDTKAIGYTLLRTRLGLNFVPSEHVMAFAQLQDSRIYGEEGSDGTISTLASLHNVDLYQGYVQIDKLLFPWLAFKFGRMRFNYGVQRLLGVNEFSNTGRSFDGSVVMLKFKHVQFDVIQSTLHESLHTPDTSRGDHLLAGLWMKYSRTKSAVYNLYALSDRDLRVDATNNPYFSRVTIGSRYDAKLDHFDLEFEANVQTGKTDFTREIFALYISSAFAYNLPMRIQPQFAIGLDYLSGDNPATEKYECFNTLYPAKHRFFGYMDYFTDIPKHTRDLGLTDIMVKSKISPAEKLRLESDLHLFQLSQSAKLKDGSSSKDLGAEIDLGLIYNYAKFVNFTFGVSAFFPGQIFKEWQGQDPSYWFFAQTTVNF
ncbi:hypothetical protein EH223_02530 [candidate division KSB1 bacterium]|nr:alginate export family protein [candidate division KSB1 bacterium]RQW06273.1 MAG: hypothetical protein EH223_02530 [candidate division KSB1 bacterium]